MSSSKRARSAAVLACVKPPGYNSATARKSSGFEKGAGGAAELPGADGCEAASLGEAGKLTACSVEPGKEADGAPSEISTSCGPAALAGSGRTSRICSSVSRKMSCTWL